MDLKTYPRLVMRIAAILIIWGGAIIIIGKPLQRGSTVSAIHWGCVLLALYLAASAVVSVAKGRVRVFVNPDPEVAIYRDVQPLVFWGFTALHAVLALAALVAAILV